MQTKKPIGAGRVLPTERYGGDMQGSVVAQRYASALFEVAKRKGVQEEIDAHLGLASELYEDPKVRMFLESPKVRVEEKMGVVRRALEKVVNPLVLRLLALLLERKRVSYLPEISSTFAMVLEESKGIVRAEVRTAIPLDEETERKLREALSRVTGRKILMEKHVDSSLIGGVHVRMGDKLLDSSIRTRLRDMKEGLLAVKVH